MKVRTKVLAVAGVVAVAAALLWRPVAEPRIVLFPSHLDRTLHYTGTVTVYVGPATGAALPTPTAEPLTVDRHLQTVAGGGAHTVVVHETLTFHAGTQVLTEENQYVMDRRTMKNVRSPLSWAIVPTNVVDRSGSYYVTLPMGASPSHAYDIWKSEVGTTEHLSADPSVARRVAGVATVGFSGVLPATKVIPAQQAQLVSQGLPGALSPAQAQARLTAAGINLGAASRALAAVLSSAELSQLTALLTTPVPVDYQWSVAGSAAVNHTTGVLVEIPSDTVTVSALPDLSGLARLVPVLAAHAQAPGIAALQRQLQAVVQAPPQPVYRLAFSETAASAASTAKAVRHQLFVLRIVRTDIPWGLGAVGAVLLAAAAATVLRARRPRPSAVAAPTGPAEYPSSPRAA
jgi:hypothetical protein